MAKVTVAGGVTAIAKEGARAVPRMLRAIAGRAAQPQSARDDFVSGVFSPERAPTVDQIRPGGPGRISRETLGPGSAPRQQPQGLTRNHKARPQHEAARSLGRLATATTGL